MKNSQPIFLDFIEIGTSDFDTLIESASNQDFGLSIDPIKYYLDRLPSPQNCRKLNFGVSDSNGSFLVKYIHPDDIELHDLPNWARGCTSINEVHPSVALLLKEKKISLNILRDVEVKVKKLSQIIKDENIDGVFLLKVDTEGHDEKILNKFFSECKKEQLPHELIFESNVLSDTNKIHELIAKLILFGYEIVKSETGGGATDTHLRLNIHRVKGRKKFTNEIKGYYLLDYPENYNPYDLPHENTLEAAKKYCKSIGKGGVSYQYGRYEVREGKYLKKSDIKNEVSSWVLIG